MNVIETSGLGKQYRHVWALRDCTMAIPAGRIVALVGPNGAGKTTLLHLTVGLTRATTGSVTVLGGVPTVRSMRLNGSPSWHRTFRSTGTFQSLRCSFWLPI
jgi:ABC-2 type transport system ATP-binding protein